MSTINDGGPAYPVTRRFTEQYMDEGGYARTRNVSVLDGGKSLRTDLAGIFMAAMISGGGKVSVDEPRIGSRMAGVAVAMADTLIAELQKVPA